MPKRSWKNNPLIGVGLLAIAVVAAWLTYRVVKPSKRDIEYSYVLKCANPNCENLFVRSYTEGQRPPFTCPACKQKQAYIALQCPSPACRRIFPSVDSPSRHPPYLCPYCKAEGRDVIAIPLEPGQKPLDEEPSDL